MEQPTDIQQLLYHLDKASDIAFRLRNNDELNYGKGEKKYIVIDTIEDLLEYNDETHLPTDNN